MNLTKKTLDMRNQAWTYLQVRSKFIVNLQWIHILMYKWATCFYCRSSFYINFMFNYTSHAHDLGHRCKLKCIEWKVCLLCLPVHVVTLQLISTEKRCQTIMQADSRPPKQAAHPLPQPRQPTLRCNMIYVQSFNVSFLFCLISKILPLTSHSIIIMYVGVIRYAASNLDTWR